MSALEDAGWEQALLEWPGTGAAYDQAGVHACRGLGYLSRKQSLVDVDNEKYEGMKAHDWSQQVTIAQSGD